VSGDSLQGAAAAVLAEVRSLDGVAPELPERLEAAVRLAGAQVLGPEELVQELGEGWVAEEAFAVGLYAVLATAPCTDTDAAATAAAAEEHFRAAVALAVNHSGDSDSTASIAGNILGAFYGEACLPAAWLDALEAPDVIRGMGDLLVGVTTS
jgi:ADP-ribosylglycohydrolase